MKSNPPLWEKETNRYWYIVFNGNSQQSKEAGENIIRIFREEIRKVIKEYDKSNKS